MRKLLFLACGLACGLASAVASASMVNDAAPVGKLTADQIVERNVAARGGSQAWQAVSTLTLSGKMEAGGKKNNELPFVLKMKRPHMSRLEIRFKDQTAVQVYDGTQGWKLRPFLGRNEVEPFTPAEAKAAADWQDLDGPLVDHAKKGTKVELQGVEAVEGHNAYKLKLTMKDGAERHLWVDTKSFLERKFDGDQRKMDGRLRNVAVYYRDFKTENGLTMPHTFETVVEALKQSHKMSIDKVTVNQAMADKLFTSPQEKVAAASDK